MRWGGSSATTSITGRTRTPSTRAALPPWRKPGAGRGFTQRCEASGGPPENPISPPIPSASEARLRRTGLRRRLPALQPEVPIHPVAPIAGNKTRGREGGVSSASLVCGPRVWSSPSAPRRRSFSERAGLRPWQEEEADDDCGSHTVGCAGGRGGESKLQGPGITSEPPFTADRYCGRRRVPPF